MTRAFLSFFAASGGVSGCQVPTSSDWQLLKLQFSPLLADWPVAMMEGTVECPENRVGEQIKSMPFSLKITIFVIVLSLWVNNSVVCLKYMLKTKIWLCESVNSQKLAFREKSKRLDIIGNWQSEEETILMKFFTPTCQIDLDFDANTLFNSEMAAQKFKIQRNGSQ